MWPHKVSQCLVGVSKRFSSSISSLAVYCLYIFFCLIRSLVDPTYALPCSLCYSYLVGLDGFRDFGQTKFKETKFREKF